METVKIHTKKGRIITLKIFQKTNSHLYGTDLFDKSTIVAIKDINSMLPVEIKENE